MRLAAFALLFSAQAAMAEVTVFAASTLKTALDEIATAYSAGTGTAVTLSYAGTPALARQIEQGAPADVFISASVDWMDALAAKGLIQPDSRRDLLGNRLVLIGPTGAAPLVLEDLAARLGEGRLAMALVDAVPSGQYGKAALESLGLWEAVAPSVVQSENVRAALHLVALGEAALGIVYASDAVAEPRVTVLATFPETSHPRIIFPVALTLTASPEAAAFLDHLASPEAAEVFAANGFLVP
jgi:molybdate transport system substrate-binding protein